MVNKDNESEFLDVDREIDFSFEEDEDSTSENGSGEVSKADIEEMIAPNKIKSVLMGEKEKLEEHAVMIDLTKVSMITEESLKAIKYLVVEDGDMDIILKVGENKRGIGKGLNQNLYELVPCMIEQLYNNEAKVYFKKKDKFVSYNTLDTSIVRLKLH